MKIATYNLRAGGRRGNLVHWTRMIEAFAPDILLVQETRHPSHYLASDVYAANANRIHWRPARDGKWGSAIFARSGLLKPLTPPKYEGYVVAAEIAGSDWSKRTGRPLRVFSLHVPAPYKRPMNEILDFIATLDDSHDLILGGDFNLAVGIRHTSEPLPTDPPWLLRRLRREFNLMSCWQAVHPNCDLPQTLRWARNPAAPYHCDGIFVPAAWYRYLEDCRVISDPGWDVLSDHNPVVVSLDC
jgi:endonuclease/exonuclease/phosphatase family metal-dependent hydrolase